MRASLHTHTARCQHASGSVRDYADAALRARLDLLGMSDHVPLVDGWSSAWRMDVSDLDAYVQDVHDTRRALPQLPILLGMECDDLPERRDWFQRELLEQRGFQYLIAGIHDIRVDGRWVNCFESLTTAQLLHAFAEAVEDAMASGLYACIAHPDTFACAGMAWNADHERATRKICAAARRYQVPIEFNGYGLRKPKIHSAEGLRPPYPWPPFWDIAAEMQAPTVINADAHRPQDVAAGLDELQERARTLGLAIVDLASQLWARG